MILIIDNYDSFTYNLVQQIGAMGYDFRVVRNDAITIAEIRQLSPSHIVISPGPGRPENAGICKDVILQFGPEIPILGVCLGHQAIAQVFGAEIGYARQLIHGKSSPVFHHESSVFKHVPNPFQAGRYHSLTITSDKLPENLQILASSDDGELMAVQHRKYPIIGVQFHPESILTENGDKIIQNFLMLKKEIQVD